MTGKKIVSILFQYENPLFYFRFINSAR